MKKMNNKGFMLAETLIVATFIMTILIFLYVQFRNVTDSYNSSFKYNTVNGIYAANNVRLFLRGEKLSKIKSDLGSYNYIDVSKCPTTYITEINYCRKLLSDLKIKTVIVTQDDLSKVKGHMSSEWDQELKDFINLLRTDSESGALRLIIQFNDDTYATLKFVEGA